MPALTEYLYVDEQRLNSCFEQVSDPVAYDKVPVWKAGLGLTGPKVEGTQDRPGRPHTTHEKLLRFIDYLIKNGLLVSGRYSWMEEWPRGVPGTFRIETMTARRGILSTDARELALWVSPPPFQDRTLSTMGVGSLLLLEDFSAPDAAHPVRWTSASWLMLLRQTLRDVKMDDQIVVPTGFDYGHASPYEILRRLGTTFGDERHISSLFQIRAFCNGFEDGGAISTIGYPIVVTTDAGLLWDAIRRLNP
jgi:hypothetical protein